VAIGSACETHDNCHWCPDELGDCVNGVCTAWAKAGEPCGRPTIDGNHPGGCALGLVCPSSTTVPRCTPPLSTGAACDPRDQSYNPCGQGSTCVYETGLCSPTERAPGDTCGSGQECKDSWCRRAGTGAGVCSAYGKLGDSCDGASCEFALVCGPDRRCAPAGDVGAACGHGGCLGGLVCANGVCRGYPGRGEPCNYGSDFFPKCAYPLSCLRYNTCGDPLPAGSACLWPFDCASGRCGCTAPGCTQGTCLAACTP
jgi:hypothetical protein